MRGLLRALFWFLGVVALVLGVLRLTLFEPWTVPDDDVLGLSISPTLARGDLVLLWTVGRREFGELVRCRDPEDPQRWVIGRIVGLEGDLVEVDPQGTVSVNGTRYNVSDACQASSFEISDDKGNSYVASCSRVEMAGGWHFRGRIPGARTDPPVRHEVGEGRVYLLSDNRTLHDDSRDFGALPADTCKEAIRFRLWGSEGFFSSPSRFEYVR